MKPMHVLLSLARAYPRDFTTCVLFATLVYFVLPIPLGLATRAFFDALAGAPAGLNVWSAIAVLVAVQLGEVLAGPLLANPWNAVQQKSQWLIRRNVFAGMLRGYGRHGLPEAVGETVSRFRDDPEIIADGLDALCDLIGRSFFAIGAAIIMWRINAPITLAVGVPMLLSTFVSDALGDRIMAYRAAARAATGRLTGFLGEMLAAQLALQVAGATRHAIDRLNEQGHVRRRLSVRDSVLDYTLDAISVNGVHLATGIVLLLGAHAIGEGTFSVGDLALFVVYLDQLSWLPEEISRLIGDLKRIDVSYGRLRAVVPGEPPAALVTSVAVVPVEPPPRDRLERLVVSHVGYSYEAGGGGIDDVSLVLERGSVTVITGRIGAGKSTLVRVLLGLLPRQRGDIQWNDRLIDDPAAFFIPPRTAYTPQVPRLFSESLRENLLLGRGDDDAALARAVHAAVLEPDVASFARGLDTLVGPRGVKLSGGQVQRAAAARMFVRDAELLVVDDLSSALDAETEAELWSRLFGRGREVTWLIVSHRPGALRRADQVLLLEGGRLTRVR